MLILQEEVMFLYRSTFTIWLHGTLCLWEEQEKVIGRRKFNDVELSDEEKPQNAHNAVTNIGDDLKIVRANMPFANTSKGEYGT